MTVALLVALEGIDGSGKGTQAQQLTKRLSEAGVPTALISFPRYDATLFGRAVGEFLNGRFGALNEVAPFLASLLYAGDRFESRSFLLDTMAVNDVVVLDRYVASNIAHQGAKVPAAERPQFIERVTQVEYAIFGLPRADLTILLDLPASTAQTLIAQKQARTYTNKKADLQEADGTYLETVRQLYLDVSASEPGWRRIDCLRAGSLRTIDDIATEIWSAVESRLKP